MSVRLALLLSLAGLLAVCGRVEAKANKVKIAVYYEALCPDSKKFVTEQLYPAWQQFRGSILVKLVPYGKATHEKVDGKWVFTCQHGPRECDGNKIQGCVLKSKDLGASRDEDQKKFEIINCLMAQPDPDLALDHCKETLKVSPQAASGIKACAEGPRGSALLASYGDKTDKVKKPLTFVPTIVFNEVKVSVYYEALCYDSMAFITRQLQPAWKERADRMQVEMIPYGKAIHYRDNDTEKWHFECQHGEPECLANKEHACILDSSHMPFTDKLALINCLMMDYRTNFQTCASEVKLSAEARAQVRLCKDGPKGSDLLAVHGDRTWALGFNLSFVPTVIFNDVFDGALQDESLWNLKAIIERLSSPSADAPHH